MKWKDEDLPALHELESTVLRFWTGRDEMNDYTAGRAYQAAYELYRARLRGHEPKPSALKGADLEVFDGVREVCEKLLTAGAKPMEGMTGGNTNPISLEKLTEYLRELSRSVERHTQRGGRCGYLEFLRGYIR